MTRRRHPHAKIVTRFTKIPDQLEDGKVRCICSAIVKLTPRGKLYAHQTPAGDECTHHAAYGPRVQLDELPPVQVPPERTVHRDVVKTRPPRRLPDPIEIEIDARLAPRTGHCVDCGRPLPPGRTLCGRDLNRRARERGRGI